MSSLCIEFFAVLNLNFFLRNQNICSSLEAASTLFNAHFLEKVPGKAPTNKRESASFLRNQGSAFPEVLVRAGGGRELYAWPGGVVGRPLNE